MRIFLDANVLFSAAKSDGAVRRLLTWLVDAGHECWADGYVVEEARRNLIAKAPTGVPVLAALLVRIHLSAAQPHPAALEATLPVPEKDRPVLAAAIRTHCEALVTGDRTHFGALYGKTLGGVTIYSPSLLARTLLVGRAQ
jgi:predicted nucleic acid-binding protein